MVDADTKLQAVLQTLVADPLAGILNFVRLHVDELPRVLVWVSRHKGDDVKSSEPRLSPRRHKDKSWLHAVSLDRMVLDRMEARLIHLCHPRDKLLLWIPLDVRCHWHRPHRRLEVVEAYNPDAQPVSDVVRVGQGCAQADEADGLVQVARDISHSGHDDFQNGPSILPQQVDLVDDDEADLSHVRSVLPVPRDAVPLLGRHDHNVSSLERFDVWSEVACELDD
mmetsp:Transcript_22270/g.39649  ORF Transcript_22270/g.39649 Transcript_22270/m.39649 type:complete len:224 (+) Transcript_22270:1484-2155(+)